MKPDYAEEDSHAEEAAGRAPRGAGAPTPTVRSVERAGAIMEALFSAPHGLRLVELSETLGLHKTTVLRLLKTLIAFHMVRRTPDDRYRWEPLRWLAVAAQVARHSSTYDLVCTRLEEVARASGQSAALCAPDGSARRVMMISATAPSPRASIWAPVCAPRCTRARWASSTWPASPRRRWRRISGPG